MLSNCYIIESSFFMHIHWNCLKYEINAKIHFFGITSDVFQNGCKMRVYEECEMVFVSLRLSCGVCVSMH